MTTFTAESTAPNRAIRQQQLANETNFATYTIPQMPDAEADDIYERAMEAERALASPGLTIEGYDGGTARTVDELLVVQGIGTLLTAEHATAHWRFNKDAPARHWVGSDYGTAALSQLVHEDTGAAHIVPTGRQTMDANHDVQHPLKQAMSNVLASDAIRAHFGLHGINLGRVRSLADERGFNIILGVGSDPSDETKDLADKLLVVAKKYDLRIGINQPVMQFLDADGTPKTNEDGTNKTITFAAKTAGTTRTHAQKAAQELGKPLATIQLEISQALRLLPGEHKQYPGRDSQRMGVYLGYLFVKESAEAVLLG